MGNCGSNDNSGATAAAGKRKAAVQHPLALPFSPALHAHSVEAVNAECTASIAAAIAEASERSVSNGVASLEPPAEESDKIIRRIVGYARARHGINPDPHQFLPPAPRAEEILEATARCVAWLHDVREAQDPHAREACAKYFASNTSDDSAYGVSAVQSSSPQHSGASELPLQQPNPPRPSYHHHEHDLEQRGLSGRREQRRQRRQRHQRRES